MKNVLQVLIVLGIGYAGGFRAGYSKSREKCIEAIINAMPSENK